MVWLISRRKKKEPLIKENKTKEYSVPGLLLNSRKGFSTLQKIKVEGGEMILDPKEKETIYSGVIPQVIEISSNIIPSRIARMFLAPKFRARIHYRLFDQPFTRDLYTGGILDPEKKQEVLIERGFMDKEGFLLQEKSGERFVIDGCYAKVDVSDIDFIKSEFHACEQSKAAIGVAAAMKKTGHSMDSMWKWIMIAAFASIVLVVFMMSGGAEGWI